VTAIVTETVTVIGTRTKEMTAKEIEIEIEIEIETGTGMTETEIETGIETVKMIDVVKRRVITETEIVTGVTVTETVIGTGTGTVTGIGETKIGVTGIATGIAMTIATAGVIVTVSVTMTKVTTARRSGVQGRLAQRSRKNQAVKIERLLRRRVMQNGVAGPSGTRAALQKETVAVVVLHL